MAQEHTRRQRHTDYVRDRRIVATLAQGPRTLPEISLLYYGYLRVLGLVKNGEQLAQKGEPSLQERLEDLVGRGWVGHDGEHYALTALGREQVDERLVGLSENGTLIRGLLQPQTVSKITFCVHLALVAIKLPAGLLSGSVALLNDALDTLMDVIASMLVYLGLRFNRERTINVALIALMLGTGLVTLFEAIRRFLVASAPDADGYAFLAAIVSAVVCLALWAYQRYVGLRGGVMALITQSVDSRNHVIVAASVSAGLVASLFHFPTLDTVVGLAVSLLILKSAAELATDVARSQGKEDVDLSRYEPGIAILYEQYRQAQLRDWMLYLVEKQGVQTPAELMERVRQGLDASRIPAWRAMGLATSGSQRFDAELHMAELIRLGWLAGGEHLTVTDAGRQRLHAWT